MAEHNRLLGLEEFPAMRRDRDPENWRANMLIAHLVPKALIFAVSTTIKWK